MRNRQRIDVNHRVTFQLDEETQEMIFKRFVKAVRYRLVQVFPFAWKILLQLEILKSKTKKQASAKSLVCTR